MAWKMLPMLAESLVYIFKTKTVLLEDRQSPKHVGSKESDTAGCFIV